MLNRKDTSLLVESWRKFINEDSDSNNDDYLDGGILEEFIKAHNIEKNSAENLMHSLHSDQSNNRHGKGEKVGGSNSNPESSDLSLEDEDTYAVIEGERFNNGVYYVTHTGVWCLPLIESPGVNTREAFDNFPSFLKSKGFKSKATKNNPSFLK
jgi:hypothetical protein